MVEKYFVRYTREYPTDNLLVYTQTFTGTAEVDTEGKDADTIVNEIHNQIYSKVPNKDHLLYIVAINKL